MGENTMAGIFLDDSCMHSESPLEHRENAPHPETPSLGTVRQLFGLCCTGFQAVLFDMRRSILYL